MNIPARLLLTLSAAALLSACDRSAPRLGPEAVRELGELQFDCTQGEDEQAQEYLELFSRVQAKGDVRLASHPHRLTLLHLACFHKKPQLVRDLLRAGADPNARTLAPSAEPGMDALREGDPVLAYALVSTAPGGTPAADIIPLVDELLAAGADVRALDAQGLPLLMLATLNAHPTAEEVFLHLLARGAVTEGQPKNDMAACFSLGQWVAGRCWPRAIEALLAKGMAPTGMLAELANHAGAPGALDGARLLLKAGASPNEMSADGTPALYQAAAMLTALLRDEEAPAENIGQARELVLMLLRAGADASQPCGPESSQPGFCAADLLREDKDLPAALSAAGLPPLPPFEVNLSGEGEALLAQVCRASMIDHEFGDEVFAPWADTLARLLASPTEAMTASELYPLAAAKALGLLARVDAARAAQLLPGLPCWRDVQAWADSSSLNRMLLHALEANEALAPPADFLHAQAVALEAAGFREAAATLVEMLARHDDADELIASCGGDTRIGIRVGGLTARLLRAGLPVPRNGRVADWLEERGLAGATLPPAVQTALHATTLEPVWMGYATDEQRTTFIATLRSIGADEEAAFYESPASELPQDFALKLEEKTAGYIWENRAAFEQLGQAQD